MNRKTLAMLLLAVLGTGAQAQQSGKQIYVPEDLRGMNLQSDTSQWSLLRTVGTDDVVFFWERGFGSDTANPPALDGHSMSFDMGQLVRRVQTFYNFYRDTLQFIRPETSNAGRYKMMVMVNYSLDGTAYGGTYDDFIGALWVAPNRIQDSTMNCMAHELGHSFQAQIMADGDGEAWGGSGFFEMTSQWMLWQVNPWWLRDENYHFEAFKTLTHKAYLAMDNIYHSPYVIQWWADLHGRTAIAELYRQGRIGEDPVVTYKRMYGLSQRQFCDEMFQGYQHLLNFDFGHARTETRPYACTFSSDVEGQGGGWMAPRQVPEAYGFNAIRLDHLLWQGQRPLRRAELRLRGDQLRYGFVAVMADGRSVYSPVGATSFQLPADGQVARLYLLVMGAPDVHSQLPMPAWDDEAPQPYTPPTFPYQFKVEAVY